MSQYCSGAITPRQEATDLIAHALNVSIPWLMGFDVPMDPIAAEDLPADETELLEIFRGMTEQGRALILANARMLRDMKEYNT